jgi:hypothetical protein
MRLRSKTSHLLLLTAFLACFAGRVGAQVCTPGDYDKPVSKAAKTTCLDLLRQVFPDADAEGRATKTVGLRAIDGDEAQEYEGAMKFEVARTEWLDTAQGRGLALVIKVTSDKDVGFVWGGLNLLALYDKLQTRLLDVVDVSGDRENYLWGVLRLHPNLGVVVFEHAHLNAGEDYRSFSLAYADKGRFKPLFDGFFLYSGRRVGAEITETGHLATAPTPGDAYHAIVFNVKVTGRRYAKDDKTVKSQSVRRFSLRVARRRDGKYAYTDGGATLKRMAREERRLGFGKE